MQNDVVNDNNLQNRGILKKRDVNGKLLSPRCAIPCLYGY